MEDDEMEKIINTLNDLEDYVEFEDDDAFKEDASLFVEF